MMVKAPLVVQPYDRHVYPLYPRLAGGAIDRVLYLAADSTVLGGIVPEERQGRFLAPYHDFLRAVYEAEHSEPSVFIDGVKSLSRIKALRAFDENTVSGVIHLVRSPGDFAKSGNRKKAGFAEFATNIMRWRSYHKIASRLNDRTPYIRISYEDLATDTEVVMDKLFSFMRVPGLRMHELRANMQSEWYFLGNASLNSFSGDISRSRHSLNFLEKLTVRSMAGSGVTR